MKLKMFKKLRKSVISVLIVLTMLAGMLPLSYISVNAAVKDYFKEAYDWARTQAANGTPVTSGGYSYFPTLVGRALNNNDSANKIQNNLSEIGSGTLAGQIEAISGVEKRSVSSYSDLNDGYTYVLYGGTFIGFYNSAYGNPLVYNNGTSGRPVAVSYYMSFHTAYRFIEQQQDAEPAVDVGDNFLAYINVAGHSSKPNQISRTLSYINDGTKIKNDDGKGDIRAQVPNYTDTTNNDNRKQIWRFIKHKDSSGNWDGYYLIENYNRPGYYLNNDYNKAVNGNPVHIYNSGTEEPASHWKIIKYSAFSFGSGAQANAQVYMILPRCSDSIALNVDTTTQTGVHLWTPDKSQSDGSYAFYIYKINEVANGLNAVINNSGREATRVAVDTSDKNLVKFKTKAELSAEHSEQDKQVWIFERQNGTEYPPIYKIKNRQTNLYLQVNGDQQGENDLNVGADNGDDRKQKWILLGENTNNINFISLADNTATHGTGLDNSFWQNVNNSAGAPYTYMSMEAYGHNTADGQKVTTYANNLSNAQCFTISRYWVDMGDFYSSIKSNKNSQYAISLSFDGKSTKFEGVHQDITNDVTLRRIHKDAADQTWYFQALGDGSYVIRNLANGNVLDVPEAKYENGIWAHPYNGSNAQKWYIVQELNGNYSLSSYLSFDYAIDIPGGNITAGNTEQNNLQAYPANGTDAQTWQFEFENTTAPGWGENLGDTFWAYISPSAYPDRYMHCGDTYQPADDNTDAKTRCLEITDDSLKRKQENYWKFVRNYDGSYTITSCNVENSSLDRRNGIGENGFAKDNDVALWSSSDTNAYVQRWFIRKYAGGYTIESKLDGKVLTLLSDYSVMAQDPTEAKTGQLFNIIKTDLTVQSDLPNVKMNLFNYGNAINDASGGILSFFQSAYADGSDGSVDGKATQTDYNQASDGDFIPKMSKTLDEYGFPVVDEYTIKNASSSNYGVTKSGSLKYLFDPEMGKDTNGFVKGNGSQESYNTAAETVSYQSQRFSVNNPASLFRKNESTGMYYYDSLLNAAYFQRDKDENGNELTSGNFNLYDYTFRRSNNDQYSSSDPTTITGMDTHIGHFFPFDLGHEKGHISQTTINQGNTDYRKKIELGAENKYVKEGYVKNDDYVPVAYQNNQDESIDTWFGMSLECEFEQTSDGTFNGNDIEFEFKGDDDVWVYIDNVLVLDIGGAHAPRTGSLNLRTGAVSYPKRNDDTNSSDYGKVTNEQVNTNLLQLFKDAGVRTSAFNTLDKSDTEQNETLTFAPNTKHTLKFFILERGGADSYFHLMFNLPKGTPSVTKKVENANTSLTDNTKYAFKLEEKKPDGKYGPFRDGTTSGITYTLENADGTSAVDKDITLNADGTFYLQADQTAYFHNIDDGKHYRVTELNANQYNGSKAVYKTNSSGSTVSTDYNYNSSSGNDFVVVPANDEALQTNVAQDIVFTNTLDTRSLTVKKAVNNYNETPIESMTNVVYNFGLRVYKNNGDGSTTEYGTFKFSINGDRDSLAAGKTISGLPKGASYDLWEYLPTDQVNRYNAPTFKDNNQSKTVTGRLVETSGSPTQNDIITGTVDDNIVTVTNKLLESQTITLTMKYYDRKIEAGKPANIDENETAFTKKVKLNSSNSTIKNNKIVSVHLPQIIADAGVALDKAVTNIVDDYELYTSQKIAQNTVTNKTYTWGINDPDGQFASHKITSDEAVYHTNSKRQPINDLSKQEKWVTYYQAGEAVDAENPSFNDFDKITNITVWLYNTPHEYTVTTHVPNDKGTKQDGKTLTYKAYYNQLLGSDPTNTNLIGGDGNKYKSEYEFYCDTYSIPKDEYNARGYVLDASGKPTGNGYQTGGASDKFDGKDFSHWADQYGNPVSTQKNYNFRVTQDMDLYAKYGEAVKGVYTSNGGVDIYYTTDGVQKFRINTVMNPYGFANGSGGGNPNIKETAVAYLTLNDAGKALNSITSAQSQEISKQIADKLNGEWTGEWTYTNGKCTLKIPEVKITVGDEATSDPNPTNIGSILMIAYKVNSRDNGYAIKLTDRNRIQFSGSYTANETNRNKQILAFTSLYYNDGTYNPDENKWYVSSNCTDNKLVDNQRNEIKENAFDGNTVWVDAAPKDLDSTLSLIKMYKNSGDDTEAISDDVYSFYTPQAATLEALPVYYSGYSTVEIGDYTIKNGTKYKFETGKTYALKLNGQNAGTVQFYQSTASALYLQTKEDFPEGIHATNSKGEPLDNKDDFSLKGGKFAVSESAKDTLTVKESALSKIKGRGNGSWADSYNFIGKYSYNITLAEKTKLFDKMNEGKKYCLLANNGDEAFVRNSTALTLGKKVQETFGSKLYSSSFQYADVYDNGVYRGSYLVTDKVEINKQSVNLKTNFDDLNEAANPDTDFETVRKSSSGNLNDTSTKGYKKWVDITEPSVAAKDGSYLLEVELSIRLPDEKSGFISNKGQAVVVKTPEYASKNQIDFISGLYNKAEKLIYDNMTYNEVKGTYTALNREATFEELNKIIDVDSFILVYFIQELAKNLDACQTSYYIYYDGKVDGRLHAGPVWDYDQAFGQNNSTRRITPLTWEMHSNYDGWFASNKYIYGKESDTSSTFNFQSALMKNNNVWTQARTLWQGDNGFYNIVKAYIDGDKNTEGTLAYYREEVKASAGMNESRWGLIEKDLLGDRTDTGESFDVTSKFLEDWIRARLEWLDKGTLIQDTGTYIDGNYGVDGKLKCNCEHNITPLGSSAATFRRNYYSNTDNIVFACTNSTDRLYNLAVTGTNVIVYKWSTNNDQRWTLKLQSDGSYIIMNKDQTSKCLTSNIINTTDTTAGTDKRGDTFNKTNVTVEENKGLDTQKWYIMTNNSYIYLVPKCSNSVLDVAGGEVNKNGTNIGTFRNNGSGAQWFNVETK